MFAGQQASGTAAIAADLYALFTHLHKTCNAGLFEALGDADLSMTQVKTLHYLDALGADEEVTLKQLAELIPVSLPAASRAIDELFRRALVERREDEVDRRMKRVRITGTGRRLVNKLNEARLIGLEQFVAELPSAEQAALGSALQTLLADDQISACRPTGDTTR
jgi:DNA-binding MarR family transcriptional regulator